MNRLAAETGLLRLGRSSGVWASGSSRRVSTTLSKAASGAEDFGDLSRFQRGAAGTPQSLMSRSAYLMGRRCFFSTSTSTSNSSPSSDSNTSDAGSQPQQEQPQPQQPQQRVEESKEIWQPLNTNQAYKHTLPLLAFGGLSLGWLVLPFTALKILSPFASAVWVAPIPYAMIRATKKAVNWASRKITEFAVSPPDLSIWNLERDDPEEIAERVKLSWTTAFGRYEARLCDIDYFALFKPGWPKVWRIASLEAIRQYTTQETNKSDPNPIIVEMAEGIELEAEEAAVSAESKKPLTQDELDRYWAGKTFSFEYSTTDDQEYHTDAALRWLEKVHVKLLQNRNMLKPDEVAAPPEHSSTADQEKKTEKEIQ